MATPKTPIVLTVSLDAQQRAALNRGEDVSIVMLRGGDPPALTVVVKAKDEPSPPPPLAPIPEPRRPRTPEDDAETMRRMDEAIEEQRRMLGYTR